MIRNYIKVAWRSIIRNKVYSFINIVGLALGITCFLLIMLWVNDEVTFNKYHENLHRIFRVMEFQNYADRIGTTQSTPGTLGPHLKVTYPEIEYVSRFTWNEQTLLSVEDQNFYESTKYVDPDFLRIFTFDMVHGDKETALDDKYSVLISREVALKYFGKEDAIGELMMARNEQNLKVTGVFDTWPDNTTFGDFDVVMSAVEFVERNEWAAQWDNNNLRTAITLKDPSGYKSFERKIRNILREKVEDNDIDLWLQPFTQTHLYNDYENGEQSGGRILYVRIFTVIGVFILLIACINFMNLATAQAVKRAKEVGLRKVVGAFKNNLIAQFLSESMVFAVIAGVIATVLTATLMPFFNEVADKELVFQLDPFTTLVISLVVILTGIISGSYPAFVISRYQPVSVLKGQISTGKAAAKFRKLLVVFQFLLSIVMIFSTIVVYQQLNFVQSQDTGFDKSGLIYTRLHQDMSTKYDVVKTRLKSNPVIQNATASAFSPLRFGNSTWNVEWPGKDPQTKILFTTISVDFDYIETMGLSLVTGRSYDAKYATDTSHYIINEIAANKMGFTAEEAIGQPITLWEDRKGKVIGVLKDYNYYSLHTDIRPLLFINNPDWLTYLIVRTSGSNIQATLSALEEISEEFAPAYPFDYEFVDDDWASFYEAEDRTGKLFNGFSIISIFIACLGLFGLSAFAIQQRTKEIGVRKVLGASLKSIIQLVSRDFIVLVLVAAFIGSPIAWYFMDEWLENFAFHIELDLFMVVASVLIVLLVAISTVLYHSMRAARTNPVQALRYE